MALLSSLKASLNTDAQTDMTVVGVDCRLDQIVLIANWLSHETPHPTPSRIPQSGSAHGGYPQEDGTTPQHSA